MYTFLIITASLTCNACSDQKSDILFDSTPHLRTLYTDASWRLKESKANSISYNILKRPSALCILLIAPVQIMHITVEYAMQKRRALPTLAEN